MGKLIFDPTQMGEHEGHALRLQKPAMTGKELHYSPLLQAGFISAVPDPGGPISYRKQLQRARDQKDKGACYGFAGRSVLEYHARNRGIYPEGGLSPAYLCSKCKAQDGCPDQEGSDNKTLARVMRVSGSCLETSLPYENMLKLSGAKICPVTSAMDAEAAKFKVSRTAFVLSTLDLNRDNAEYLIRQALLQYGPQIIGINVFSSFIPDAEGLIPVPGTTSEKDYFRGNHDVCLSGHNPDSEKRFEFENSWGEEWGDEGFGHLAAGWEKGYCDPTGGGDKAWFLMESLAVLVDKEPVPVPDPEPGSGLIPSICEAKEIDLQIGLPTITVDGKAYPLSPAPIIPPGGDRTLEPIGLIAQYMGYDTIWYPTGQRITIRKK